MTGESPRVCRIGYRVGFTDTGMRVGYRFSSLDVCCVRFKTWFNETGNSKPQSFNLTDVASRDGFVLTMSGGDEGFVIELRISEGRSSSRASKMEFCPFCGAKIEIIEKEKVVLTSRFKQVSDGYEETPTKDQGTISS